MTVPLENLMKHISNRYQLVLIAARRGNELVSGAPPLVGGKLGKIAAIALEEIGEGKVQYEPAKESKKS